MAHLQAVPTQATDGRNETDLERCDRNLVELLQEVRVVQTGVQVLFAFLLMAPLTPVFRHLDGRQHIEYYVTFAFAGLAAFLLIAPTAYHRVLFQRGDKFYLVRIANRLTIAGLGAVGISMIGAVVFVTDLIVGPGAAVAAGLIAAGLCGGLWAALPMARRQTLE
jgi:O-antigen/teichoic acid export membrane protein